MSTPSLIEFRLLPERAVLGKKRFSTAKSNLYYSPIKFSFYHLCSGEFNYFSYSTIHSNRVTQTIRADFVGSAFACLAGWHFGARSDLDREEHYRSTDTMTRSLSRCLFISYSLLACLIGYHYNSVDSTLLRCVDFRAFWHSSARGWLPKISHWLSHDGRTTSVRSKARGRALRWRCIFNNLFSMRWLHVPHGY